MKGILEFDLNEYDEELKFKAAVRHRELTNALYQLKEYFRTKYKHKDPTTPEALVEFDEIREKFYEILHDNGVADLLD